MITHGIAIDDRHFESKKQCRDTSLVFHKDGISYYDSIIVAITVALLR